MDLFRFKQIYWSLPGDPVISFTKNTAATTNIALYVSIYLNIVRFVNDYPENRI